jgi:hypothetical protein
MAGPPPFAPSDPVRLIALRLGLEDHEQTATTGDQKRCRCDGVWRTYREHRAHVAEYLEQVVEECELLAQASGR